MLIEGNMLIQCKQRVAHWEQVTVEETADVIRTDRESCLVIDTRSFLEHNTCHLTNSVNVCCSKLVKRRLQQDKISVLELLSAACKRDVEAWMFDEIIVYDQCTVSHEFLTDDSFLVVLVSKLKNVFKCVKLLKGGFLEFQAAHPSLCENKCSLDYKSSSLTSMSQPCLSVRNVGPTRILPFLFLGSQYDAASQDCIKVNGISYVLNVSTTCPKPAFIQDSSFLRIPVNDNYNDKLLPHFYTAFQFLDKVKEANGCVLVHCLAGISRSPTLAIAYVMRHLKMTSDDAYRYVKDKRPTISPNFNFLGQLLEFERQMKLENGFDSPLQSPDVPKTPTRRLHPRLVFPKEAQSPTTGLAKLNFNQASAQSPTTALAKLNFNREPPPSPDVQAYPTTSLDKLNFTPCFTAREDKLTSPWFTVRDDKRPLAVKRPLSTSAVERPKPEPESLVTLRSPELRAKRPLVRPNSIAFYPRGESRVETGSRDESRESVDDSARGDRNKRTCIEGNARKARSLEDILASDDDSPTRLCRCPGTPLTPAEGAGAGLGGSGNSAGNGTSSGASSGPPCRCPDTHQSNSSISSTGSRTSLHGSLEMIPVS